MRDRLLKAAICTFVFCLFVGIFVGVAIHFGKESVSADSALTANGGRVSGGASFGVALR
jgi:hypothetical protein